MEEVVVSPLSVRHSGSSADAPSAVSSQAPPSRH
jgi:hypothetical protein